MILMGDLAGFIFLDTESRVLLGRKFPLVNAEGSEDLHGMDVVGSSLEAMAYVSGTHHIAWLFLDLGLTVGKNSTVPQFRSPHEPIAYRASDPTTRVRRARAKIGDSDALGD